MDVQNHGQLDDGDCTDVNVVGTLGCPGGSSEHNVEVTLLGVKNVGSMGVGDVGVGGVGEGLVSGLFARAEDVELHGFDVKEFEKDSLVGIFREEMDAGGLGVHSCKSDVVLFAGSNGGRDQCVVTSEGAGFLLLHTLHSHCLVLSVDLSGESHGDHSPSCVHIEGAEGEHSGDLSRADIDAEGGVLSTGGRILNSHGCLGGVEHGVGTAAQKAAVNITANHGTNGVAKVSHTETAGPATLGVEGELRGIVSVLKGGALKLQLGHVVNLLRRVSNGVVAHSAVGCVEVDEGRVLELHHQAVSSTHTVDAVPRKRAHSRGHGGGTAVHRATLGIDVARLCTVGLLRNLDSDPTHSLSEHGVTGSGEGVTGIVGAARGGLRACGCRGGTDEKGVLDGDPRNAGVDLVEGETDVRVGSHNTVHLDGGAGISSKDTDVSGLPDLPAGDTSALLTDLGEHVGTDESTRDLVATDGSSRSGSICGPVAVAVLCNENESCVLRPRSHVVSDGCCGCVKEEGCVGSQPEVLSLLRISEGSDGKVASDGRTDGSPEGLNGVSLCVEENVVEQLDCLCTLHDDSVVEEVE
mmetsp:Transcript_54290/g.106237  ORF Transcript_54290/g.106237 Transcript_54290/m.106237 type:complete len:580 (+) Transcript_54290:1332-3071(+)